MLRTSLCYMLRQMCSISVAADNAMVGYKVGSFLQLPLGKDLKLMTPLLMVGNDR